MRYKLFAIATLILFSALSVPMKGNSLLDQKEKEEKQETVIQSQKLEGTVEVSFKINAEGTVDILNIQSTNPELIDYVVKKLKKIKLQNKEEVVGKTIHYRFEFKKQV